MKTKEFDIECAGCHGRVKFTLRQSPSRIPGDGGRLIWSPTEMIRCQSCGGVSTVAVHVSAAHPDPEVAATKFVGLTRSGG